MDPITNEDGWYYHRAQEMLGYGLSRPLAPFHEAVQFSVETVMHTRPFGVHQVWHHLTPDDEMVVRAHIHVSRQCVCVLKEESAA